MASAVGTWIPWVAVSALVACLALLSTFLIHIIKYGEEKGSTRERIKRLEQEMIDQKDMKESVIELRATVANLTITVGELRALLQMMSSHQRMQFSQER